MQNLRLYLRSQRFQKAHKKSCLELEKDQKLKILNRRKKQKSCRNPSGRGLTKILKGSQLELEIQTLYYWIQIVEQIIRNL